MVARYFWGWRKCLSAVEGNLIGAVVFGFVLLVPAVMELRNPAANGGGIALCCGISYFFAWRGRIFVFLGLNG